MVGLVESIADDKNTNRFVFGDYIGIEITSRVKYYNS